MTNPLVSVIIPAYNSEPYVEEAVQSVLEQTYSPLEVIVVDDGSKDGTAARLARFGDRIRLLRQENQGVYRTRNNAARLAKGEFLAFLDADDFWVKDKLVQQMDVFQRHPDVAVVASRVFEVDASGKPLAEPARPEGDVYDKPMDLHRRLLMGGNCFALSTAVVRRSIFESMNGFYDAKRILSADYDFWIRLSERYLAYIMSEPLAAYRILENSLLHGSLDKEYKAQLGIIEMSRHRYSPGDWNRRLAKLYYDWADSANDQRDDDAGPAWRNAVRYNPWSARVWVLGAKILVKSYLC